MENSILFIIKAIIMGIIEGITEFIPISSTAHLIITGEIIKFKDPEAFVNMFNVVIQLGAILAIVVLYWDKIWSSLKNLKPGKWGFKLWTNIVIGSIPAAIIGYFFEDIIEKKMMGIKTVAFAMLIGGILLIVVENTFRRKAKIRDINRINYRQAFIIGCFQCLAILWPGMSRSASTIMGSWIVGLSSFAAAEFSFFLAIPAMFGASFLKIIKMKSAMTSIEIIALAAGFLMSFIVALVVVEKFIAFLKKRPMRIFSIYRILVGIILIVLIFTKVIV